MHFLAQELYIPQRHERPYNKTGTPSAERGMPNADRRVDPEVLWPTRAIPRFASHFWTNRRTACSDDEAWASVDRYEQIWFLPVWPDCDISHRRGSRGGLDLHERRLLMATTKFHFSEPEHGLNDRVAETRLRETALARMVMAYIGTGLAFMLLPGTFLGVWNLLSSSNKHAANSVSAAWIQAHGQAQVFGWIGTFILGIGFYSIPKMRRSQPFAMWAAWACWAVWSTGVLLRWVATVYEWHWRVMLPVSAGLQLLAFIAFFTAVSSHLQSSYGRVGDDTPRT
jgi:hypothetical protein